MGPVKTGYLVATILVCSLVISPLREAPPEAAVIIHETQLPTPDFQGKFSLESTLANRREADGFAPHHPLTDAELGQMLWAAAWGTGSSRSGDQLQEHLCDLHIYAVTRSNLHLYDPVDHTCRSSLRGGLIDSLATLTDFASAPLVTDAVVMVILTGNGEACADHLGKRGVGLLPLRAGRATQNLLLQARSLGLSTRVCELFLRDPVARLLRIPEDQQPLALIAIGGVKGSSSK